MEISKEIMKFVSANAELKRMGQGNITITCSKLWNMSNEEFEREFGVKLMED